MKHEETPRQEAKRLKLCYMVLIVDDLYAEPKLTRAAKTSIEVAVSAATAEKARKLLQEIIDGPWRRR